MIHRIDLSYFKCFELLKLPVGKLTLLSGANASGKSSLLQSLVLLHQNVVEHEWSTRLLLNGPELCLGTVSDVVDKVNGRRCFEIGIVDDEAEYRWSFSGERTEMSMQVDGVSVDANAEEQPRSLRYLLPLSHPERCSLSDRLRSLTYITAERLGPREFYRLDDPQVAPVVGPTGEHAVSVLHLGRTELVNPSLVLDGAPSTRLHQVEARMRQFFPGCGLAVQHVPQTNAVTLGLRTSDDTDYHRPVHVGFGLTQVLPIVVAALSAKVEDLLLIENPEVHLHPAGQALMGQFLSEVARAGVQVILETHSDHILNGIRRSVKSRTLTEGEVVIHFFRPRTQGEPQVISPQLDETGNIDSWPPGFFDQFDKDMNHFAGWGQ